MAALTLLDRSPIINSHMKKLFYLVILLTLASISSFACSCATPPPFCESIAKKGNLITAKIDSLILYPETYPPKMRIQIFDIVQGDDFKESEVVNIYGGSGADCLSTLSHFSVGEILMLQPNKIDTTTNWYLYGSCDSHFVSIDTMLVDYKLFKDSIMVCLKSTPVHSTLIEESDINVFPNPVSNYLRFSSSIEIQEVVLFNSIGQAILRETINAYNAALSITNIPPGVYFAFFRKENKQIEIKRLSKISN